MVKNRKITTYYTNLKLIGLISILFAMVFALSYDTYGKYLYRGTLSGVAIVPAKDGNVVITKVEYDTSTNASENDSSNTFSGTTLDSSITLGSSAPSSITYTVTIKNNTDKPQEFVDVTVNTFDNNDMEYTYSGIQTDDILGPKEEVEVSVTFKYKDDLTNVTNQDLTSSITFNFDEAEVAAKIGNKYYRTLQLAIDDVPDDGTHTTVELLKDVSENLKVEVGQYVVFDFGDYTISNDTNTNTLRVYGGAEISNGHIKCNAGSGAVNAESNSTLIITGGTFEATGTRQALYNDGGTVTISGNPSFSSTTNVRATVHNKNGTMIIRGGTARSYNYIALNNEATLIIGTPDGVAHNDSPLFIGETQGVVSNKNYEFYDGKAMGITKALSNNNYAATLENGYDLVHPPEMIGNKTYKTTYLGHPATVRFNASGGIVSETQRIVEINQPISLLPYPTRDGYIFDGWFTAASPNGDEVIEDETIVTADITYYAHWVKSDEVVQVGNDIYDTFNQAISNVPDNTPTTITLLQNIREKISIPENKIVTIDLNGKTMYDSGDNVLFENKGSLTVLGGGTITTNSNKHSAINNDEGTLIIENIDIIATGDRQGVYSTGGNVEIRDGTYISSYAEGLTNNQTPRASVQCMDNCTMTITGGTIINHIQQAITNLGDLTIGTNDGSVNSSKPTIQGETHGVYNTGTLNFYDGTIKGITDAIDGTVADQETTIASGTEVIDNKTYYTAYNS